MIRERSNEEANNEMCLLIKYSNKSAVALKKTYFQSLSIIACLLAN